MAKKQTRSMPKSWADPKATKATSRTARLSGRATWLGVGLASVPIVAAVIAIVLVIGPGSSGAGRDTLVDQEVSALLTGIPQEGRTLGSPTAPVTLQVFGDLEDEDSRHWVVRLLPAIIREFVRTGIMKIEYRSFKTNTIPSETFVKQQTAAVAAGAQGKLWNFVDTFYHEQGPEYTPYVTESYIDNIAAQVPGLDVAQWHHDRNDGRRTEQVVADDQAARADGIYTSPGYRLGRTGGQLKNFAGSESVTFANQRHPTTFASAKDFANAIGAIH